MKHSPSDVLRMVEGLHRKKLYEMMKDGLVSFSLEDGKRFIDSSELVRVFGDSFKPDGILETSKESKNKHNETEKTHLEKILFQQKIEALQERLTDKDEQIRDLRKRLDAESEERRKLTLLLMHSPEASKKPVEASQGFWARVTGKKY